MSDETILSTAECCEVITALLKTRFQLINYLIKPISDTAQGYSGQHFRATCQVKVNGQPKTVNFFIKKRKYFAGMFGEMKNQFDNYKAEATIIRILNDGNEDATWVPKLLKYIYPNLVVLEDLGERQYEMAKIKFGLFDFEHCKCMLRALAQLHAFSFNYDLKHSVPILDMPNIFFETETGEKHHLTDKWNKTGAEATIFLIKETPQNCPKDQIIQNFQAYQNQYIEGLLSKKSKYGTISHGDLWANNLMFKYNADSPIDCCLIDFQMMRYCPFTEDVLFSIYLNTNKEFRVKYLENLIEYYYEELSTVLSSKYRLEPDEIITKEEYYKLVEERKRSAIITSIWFKHYLLMDPEERAKSLDGENFQDTVFGDRVRIIKPQLSADENYRTAIFQELEDLIDAFM